MKARTRRFMWIAVGVLVLCAAAAFVLNAFQSNLVFFFTPTQVSKGEAPNGRTFRAGGMVKENSLVRDGNSVRFVITDTLQEMPVTYVGLLPDLFKEGKGVVAQGKLGNDGMFVASEVNRQKRRGSAKQDGKQIQGDGSQNHFLPPNEHHTRQDRFKRGRFFFTRNRMGF